MNAVAERHVHASTAVQGALHTGSVTRERPLAHTFLAPARVIDRVSENVVPTMIAAVLLAFSLAFAALMIGAIVVVLTCGLACYA
jgi:hypothetical protein